MSNLKTPQYDASFFQSIEAGAAMSAQVILRLVFNEVDVQSVIDVGCGQGTWLSVAKSIGASELLGLDGDYVDRELLLIDADREFMSLDLSNSFDLNRKFDLVMSLEVAEHVESKYAEIFIDNLVRHGDIVLFSAAVPGQIGVQHVNERRYEYWRDLFAKRGYHLFDFVRPNVTSNKSIEWWYRYNTFLYAKNSIATQLSEALISSRQDGKAIRDYAPSWLRFSRIFLRHIPIWMSTRIAQWGLKRSSMRKRQQ